VLVALRFSEAKEFTHLAERAHPRWLALAVLLQAATYLAEGAIWRSVVRAGHGALSVPRAYGLSVAKLFMDQTVPTGGLSGTILYVQGLQRSGVPRGVALAGVVVSTFSYYTAYALCLALAIVYTATLGDVIGATMSVGVTFLMVSTVFAVVVLWHSGAEPGPMARRLARVPFLRSALGLLQEADPAVAHAPRVLVRALLWQVAIVCLDAGTIWVALRAVGAAASTEAVFVSYMFSSLLRTLSFVPGGLGTFEAASVFMLRSLGVSVSAALSATLIFRGLSFWLPMIPGLLCARRLTRY
jgi:Mg2+-importing ATPase